MSEYEHYTTILPLTVCSILEGISHMARKMRTTHAYKIFPMIYPRKGTTVSSYYDNERYGRCFDLHLSCKERPRSFSRGLRFNRGISILRFSFDVTFLFHTTFFELHQSPTKPDSWVSGRLYSLNNAGGEPFRKACITVSYYGFNTEFAYNFGRKADG